MVLISGKGTTRCGLFAQGFVLCARLPSSVLQCAASRGLANVLLHTDTFDVPITEFFLGVDLSLISCFVPPPRGLAKVDTLSFGIQIAEVILSTSMPFVCCLRGQPHGLVVTVPWVYMTSILCASACS